MSSTSTLLYVNTPPPNNSPPTTFLARIRLTHSHRSQLPCITTCLSLSHPPSCTSLIACDIFALSLSRAHRPCRGSALFQNGLHGPFSWSYSNVTLTTSRYSLGMLMVSFPTHVAGSSLCRFNCSVPYVPFLSSILFVAFGLFFVPGGVSFIHSLHQWKIGRAPVVRTCACHRHLPFLARARAQLCHNVDPGGETMLTIIGPRNPVPAPIGGTLPSIHRNGTDATNSVA